MSAPDAPVVEVLRARLAPRLATLRAGLAPPAALLDLAVRRVDLPSGDVVLVRPRDWPALLDAERAAGRDAPFWAVTWQSGEALARRVSESAVRGRRVLDVGCGLGLLSIAAARAGADVLAVDANPDAVAFTAENLALNAVEADAAVAGGTSLTSCTPGPSTSWPAATSSTAPGAPGRCCRRWTRSSPRGARCGSRTPGGPPPRPS